MLKKWVGYWQPAEDGVLRRYWGKVKVREVARLVSEVGWMKRTREGCSSRAKRLGLRCPRRWWTVAELASLRRMHGGYTMTEMALVLGRSRQVVSKKLRALGYPPGKGGRRKKV